MLEVRFFFSGLLHSEHPHTKKAQALCKQHRGDAMGPFRQRLQVAMDFKEELAEKRALRVAAVRFVVPNC